MRSYILICAAAALGVSMSACEAGETTSPSEEPASDAVTGGNADASSATADVSADQDAGPQT
ncbi:MAG: hypothetical protein VX938_06525, partial [Myxococcota bacterium]|nr:hypothetical protein [Myxococcota bacterium]